MNQDELVSAVDAAKILGLSADMVRVLAREGKLPAAAQTVRGVRLFRRRDVEELARERAGAPAPKHVVQFYDRDDFLGATVANLMGQALRAGAPVLIIATEEHVSDFCTRMNASGVGVAAARESGLLSLHDARTVLSSFMVGGIPDGELFHAHVGGLVEKASAGRPRARLRAYGEMVDLLEADGNGDAAVRLEELWNELGRAHSFSLFCAYRLGRFGDARHGERFERICGHHTEVLPAESFAKNGSQEEGLRQITALQQRARALECEIERRGQVESALRAALDERDRAMESLRRSEEQLRRQNERLAESTRAADDLVATVGHELRNPLAPILTAFELMRLRGLESREQTIIERQVGVLTRLADELLDMSRLTRGKVELSVSRTALADVVARAVEMAGPILERRRGCLDIQVPEGLAADVDPDRMAQVIANLLTNAVRCSDPGTPITVRGVASGSCVRLSVADKGAGMAPELTDRVFDAFFQHPRSGPRLPGGLGLGLAIVRSLVQLHGGTVTARSDGPGQGSEFVVEIPAPIAFRPVAADVPAPIRTQTPIIRAASRRVLVVDDNADLAQLIAELLEHLGHEVELAHDGPSALDVAARFRPEVALLDIGLPVMDGYEVARRLRSLRDENIQLVAVTGYGQEADRRRSEEAGFSGHLVKPVSPDLLAKAVQRTPADVQLPAPAIGSVK